MKTLPTIKDRVLYFAENEEGMLKIFFKKTGLNYNNFTGKSKKSDLQSKSVAEILTTYPHLNIEWLLTGRGAMLRDYESTPKQRFAEAVSYVIQHEKITQKEIGEIIGVNPTTLNSQIKGTNNPPQNTIIALTEKYPYLSAKWILLNEGSMLIGGKEEMMAKKTDKYDSLKDKYTEILEENNKYIKENNAYLKEIIALKEIIEKQNEQIGHLSAENVALKKGSQDRQAG